MNKDFNRKPGHSRGRGKPGASRGRPGYGKPTPGRFAGRPDGRGSDRGDARPDMGYSAVLTTTAQPGLFRFKRLLLTKNLTPGRTFFDMEREIKIGNDQYREIDPSRSKFAAAIIKGVQQTGLAEDSVVLYLGASHGYTPSFFSDIVPKGMLFCVDLAPRVIRDLWFICEQRKNMAPILASANHLDEYAKLIPKEVDVVYQDIAQRDQMGIFLRNCDRFLKQGGFGMVAVKARSIDVTAHPRDLFKRIRKDLEENPAYNVIEYRELFPLEKDHAFFVVKKK